MFTYTYNKKITSEGRKAEKNTNPYGYFGRKEIRKPHFRFRDAEEDITSPETRMSTQRD
jgi:hypothetical protein